MCPRSNAEYCHQVIVNSEEEKTEVAETEEDPQIDDLQDLDFETCEKQVFKTMIHI